MIRFTRKWCVSPLQGRRQKKSCTGGSWSVANTFTPTLLKRFHSPSSQRLLACRPSISTGGSPRRLGKRLIPMSQGFDSPKPGGCSNPARKPLTHVSMWGFRARRLLAASFALSSANPRPRSAENSQDRARNNARIPAHYSHDDLDILHHPPCRGCRYGTNHSIPASRLYDLPWRDRHGPLDEVL